MIIYLLSISAIPHDDLKKKNTNIEPLFRCSGPPSTRPSIDLPAIVSRQNTDTKLNTLHNRPKTFSTVPKGKREEDESSESTTSSHGHQSTCSNPATTANKPFKHTTTSADNKSCISDPSTRQERKSAFTRPLHNHASTPGKKFVTIDVGNYEKYARDKNGNVIHTTTTNGRSFPTVTASSMDHSKLMTHTRRLVNLVYPAYGPGASITTPPPSNTPRTSGPGAILTRRSTGMSAAVMRNSNRPGVVNSGNVTDRAIFREKTTIVNGNSHAPTVGMGRVSVTRNSLDSAFTTTKLRTATEPDSHDHERMLELKLGDRAIKDNKLPLLSPPTPRSKQFL